MLGSSSSQHDVSAVHQMAIEYMEMVVSGWLEDDTLNIGTELSEMIEEFMVEANIAIRAKPELLAEYDVHLSVRWNTLKDLIMKIRHNNLESLIIDEQKLDHRKEEIAWLKPFVSANTKKQTDRKMHADGRNAKKKLVVHRIPVLTEWTRPNSHALVIFPMQKNARGYEAERGRRLNGCLMRI